jgi:hypothetical protein
LDSGRWQTEFLTATRDFRGDCPRFDELPLLMELENRLQFRLRVARGQPPVPGVEDQ